MLDTRTSDNVGHYRVEPTDVQNSTAYPNEVWVDTRCLRNLADADLLVYEIYHTGAPTAISLGNFPRGSKFTDNATGNYYTKTGDVGTNTWAQTN
jgi:hypothetical protein